MYFTESVESTTENPERKPAAAGDGRNKRKQTEWNVPTHIRETAASPTNAAIRERISNAALFVNVTANTLDGAAPAPTNAATRVVNTRVFPEPGPATTTNGPFKHCTAAACSGFKPVNSSGSIKAGSTIRGRDETDCTTGTERAEPSTRRTGPSTGKSAAVPAAYSTSNMLIDVTVTTPDETATTGA